MEINKAERFSIIEALSFSLKTLIKNFLFFIYVWMVIGLIILIEIFIAYWILSKGGSIEETSTAIFILLFSGEMVLFIFLIIIIALGLDRIALKFYDNKVPKITDLFSQPNKVISAFAAFSIYSTGTEVGKRILFFPGLYYSIQWGFYDLFIVDERLDAFKAIRKSSEITHGVILKLFVFLFFSALVIAGSVALIFVGIVLDSFLLFLLGLASLVASVTITILARAFIYRRLLISSLERKRSE